MESTRSNITHGALAIRRNDLTHLHNPGHGLLGRSDVLKREIGLLVGGEERLAFDILNARMMVTQLPPGVEPDEIAQAVRRTGLDAADDEGMNILTIPRDQMVDSLQTIPSARWR